MLGRILLVLLLAGIAAFSVYWWLTATPIRWSQVVTLPAPDAANGETIFNIGGCSSCHAVPNQPDRLKLGGGLAIASPFGTFYAPNISPDPNDGIGRWSEADFVNAVMKGVSPGGTHYFPAFPYPSYAHATVRDVRDLFAFLKTLPPVSGKVRDHDLPFPFNIRRTLGIWKLLFLDDKTFTPDPSKSAEWNRGAYLVNGPGHCAECHSPRDVLGAVIPSLRFTGGPSPDGQGGVPNITQFKLKAWTVADIAGTLEDGTTPDADRVGGSMVEVVRNTSKLTAADRTAIATYIKSLPAVEGQKPPPKKP
jgi:mono/diheme cytochrome c family protein